MHIPISITCFVFLFLNSCDGNFSIQSIANKPTHHYLNEGGLTVASRILCPEGFERVQADSNSFTYFLRQLPLKNFEADVKKFDGNPKETYVHVGVIDMPVGKSGLQQCADSGIRLYAEYLYYSGQFEKIHFNFTNGEACSWVRYAEGWRIEVKENETKWYKAAERDYSYGNFSNYLELVYMYAGSYSLSKEMEFVEMCDIRPGDFFVRPGFPGHVEIVMDVCENKTTGEKLFILAQGFTPAQEIELLKNMDAPQINPWYQANTTMVITPQADFESNLLMRFK